MLHHYIIIDKTETFRCYKFFHINHYNSITILKFTYAHCTTYVIFTYHSKNTHTISYGNFHWIKPLRNKTFYTYIKVCDKLKNYSFLIEYETIKKKKKHKYVRQYLPAFISCI